MSQSAQITRLTPNAALPGGEILLECTGLTLEPGMSFAVHCGGVPARLVGASARRVLALVPDMTDGPVVPVQLVCDGVAGPSRDLIVGELLADDLHLVANPAFDKITGALYVTRSGPRGQELPVTLFRLDSYGDLHDISGDLMNPTGLAFDKKGQLFVSSRADGTVYRVTEFAAVPFARNLGVATGIAFNGAGELFVGDRTGTIHRVNALGEARAWAELEPSVAAYHLAFGPDDALYVTGPTVSSNDAITRLDANGKAETFFSGFMRPQGMAFDIDGNLYVVACYKARRGLWRIPPSGATCEMVLAGNNLIGLCCTPDGDLIAATNDAVYNVPLGIKGLL